jgi:GNAT superfamily N-acetyltransferase
MINYREAGIKDISELAILFDEYRIFYKMESDVKGSMAFLNERTKNKQSVIFIATLENKICGFTQLYPIFSSTRMKPLLLLNDLYVNKDYRGKGISKGLIDMAKQHCMQSGACGLLLETAKDNEVPGANG